MTLEGAGAVVLHPHPEMAGDSSHPFVVEIAKRLTALGVDVCTPDIRDPDVAQAARDLAELTDSLDTERRILVGYSWGAIVVTQTAAPSVVARVLVAMPAAAPFAADVPTLVLVPEHDQFGDFAATKAAFADQHDATVEAIQGADHFLWGHIDVIATRIEQWLLALG